MSGEGEGMIQRYEEAHTGEEAASCDSAGADTPAYSLWHEFSFFFKKGVPLMLSAVMEWGFPPWVAMAFARAF